MLGIAQGEEWKAVGCVLAEQLSAGDSVEERRGGVRGRGLLLDLSPFKDGQGGGRGKEEEEERNFAGVPDEESFEELHSQDPFAPSEAGPSASGSNCPSPDVQAHRSGKVRKSLATFLYSQLAEGLRGKSHDIPRCLQLHDVLYLAHRITPTGEEMEGSSLQRVFEVFDEHLQEAVGRDEEGKRTKASLASIMGSVHGTQSLLLVQAHLGFAAEGAVEEYFTGRISDIFVCRNDSQSDADKSVKSLMKHAEHIAECSEACAAYTGCYLEVVRGRAVAGRHKNVVLATLFEPLRRAMHKETNAKWRGHLRGLLSQVNATLAKAENSLVENQFEPGKLPVGGKEEEGKTYCGWDGKTAFDLTAAKVSKPASGILDVLAHLWGKRNGQDLCADYILFATCLEILSTALTYARNMIEAESAGGHTFKFGSHMVTLSFISMLKSVAECIRRDSETYDLSVGDFDPHDQALMICCKARDLEREMSGRLGVLIERYSIRFFVTPLQNEQGAWKSEKSPEEDLQPILVGFAFFCVDLLSRARGTNLQAHVQDSMRKILLQVLCRKIVGEVYRKVTPSAKRRFRFLCDIAFLTEIGCMLKRASEAAAEEETEKEKDHAGTKAELELVVALCTESFKSLQRHAILSCCTLGTLNQIFERQFERSSKAKLALRDAPCPCPTQGGVPEPSTMISQSGKWSRRDALEWSNEFTRKLKGTIAIDKIGDGDACMVAELGLSGDTSLPWLNQEYSGMEISTSDIQSSLQPRLEELGEDEDVRGKISALNSHMARLHKR